MALECCCAINNVWNEIRYLTSILRNRWVCHIKVTTQRFFMFIDRMLVFSCLQMFYEVHGTWMEMLSYAVCPISLQIFASGITRRNV